MMAIVIYSMVAVWGGGGRLWLVDSASQKSSAFGLTTFRKVPKGPESGIFLAQKMTWPQR